MSAPETESPAPLATVSGVSFGENDFTVAFEDGRSLVVPVDWFPRLMKATPEQRANWEASPYGLHWPDVDEDISIEGLLLGRRAHPRFEPR